ncbi:TonB-linked SusC/RagA family outer membrane protein [Nonlabens dokdonensis]|uniref:TonB-dependent receptor, plug n=3 Tax=Nonlabens dokdonensis TaxID=328515 RepID=L7WCU4_NONDD|nr:TonB-dependent receptor, plug [Nonlabens dokdonensis DSW-6]PZX36665.1 TonB-linked SusC/RagA family outer membrane protein [Nonlabens dokdonensis]
MLLISCSLSAQSSRNISGKVVDAANKEEILGATIFIKGTKKGAVTSMDGTFNYTIKSNDINNAVLLISYLGYKSQEIVVGDKSVFIIELEEEIESLGEVVITSSYGTQKRREEVVGSIASIKPKELGLEQPATSIDELLQGQVAGVFIETNPNLGEPVNINIRGQGSLTPLNSSRIGTSTQPLIIVDGIFLSEELGIDGSSFFDGNGRFDENFLNPLARVGIQDIESIEILRDAAAVGLYGADAANGVIIITTANGKSGKIAYNASVQAGVSTAFNRIQYMNGEQYNEVRNLFNFNNGDFNLVTPWNGVNTDWFELLNQTGSYQRYTAGANGGVGDFRFRGSVTYQNRQESQVGNSFDQINASFGINYEGKKFKAALKVAPSLITKNNPNTLFNFALDPTIPVRDMSGNFTQVDFFGNPIAAIEQNISEATTTALLSSAQLSYEFNDLWSVRTLVGLDFSNKDQEQFFNGLNGSGIDSNGNIGRRNLRDRDTRNWNWNFNVNYKNTFNEKHNIEAIAGLETRGQKADFSFSRGRGFAVFDRPRPISEAEISDFDEDILESYNRSFFSQFNYDFDKKYFLLANFRIDQSSAFGEDNDTAYNGGLGASWVLTKEDMLSSSTFVDFLRLRVSGGFTGNSRIGSFRSLGIYEILFDGSDRLRYVQPEESAPNSNLGWERNFKFNVGVDFNFLKKYSAVVEYFKDDISDMIVQRDAIPESGYSNIQINGARMLNQGVELTLNANWLNTESFSWSTSFNLATLNNEVLDLEGTGSNQSTEQQARAQRVGTSTSAFWGFNSLGIDPATGRELFIVDGQVHDAQFVNENFTSADWEIIGDSQPDVYGGMRNNFKYKKINLSIITSYSIGNDILIGRELIDNYNQISNRNNSVDIFNNAWREVGDVAALPVVAINPSVSNSSRYVYDGSNVQLKAVTLSYNFNTEGWKIPLKTCTVNVNGSNLYYWFFNDRSTGSNGIAELRNSYPEMRTFSLGINTTF